MAGGKSKKSDKKASSKGGTKGSRSKVGSRFEAYKDLAKRFSDGAAIPLPTFLSGQARREHVRASILEDHAERIDNAAEGTQDKFATLADDLYSFFRGTALHFYRDMAGSDAARPKVMLLGDVHPGNFGVMPNAHNNPIFSVNDFDEVHYGPFTWDLKRGATGFILSAKCAGKLGRKKRRKVAKAFTKGYIAGMRRYAEYETENEDQATFRMDNSPDIILDLFEDAMEPRAEWLLDDWQDEKRTGFKPSDQNEPLSDRREEFQGYLDELAKRNEIETGGRFGELKVKDVARVHGKGTASLGLARYFIMIEGPEKDGTDDIIVEFKRARRSALAGLAPSDENDPGELAERIEEGQRIHIPSGDKFYGAVEIDGTSFMTRERAPFRDDIDKDDLSFKEWRKYAHACGQALALAHARTDDIGDVDHDIEPLILENMEPQHLFIDDITMFAQEAADRIEADWKHFKRDLKRDAYAMRHETYA
jgi:uncharacterized protein (DUF2252 family)